MKPQPAPLTIPQLTRGYHAHHTLEQARKLGKGRYFTGKPCIRGHISERWVNKRKCIACQYEDQKSPNKG